ncbi:hypothetical protein KY284_036044 [Solanum tuberosum]|nr:hypothetical protein KY284_036044 [Solanum tuberosum]
MEQQKIEKNSKHGDTRISQDLDDQLGNTQSISLEVIEVESSSQFSFGVKPTDTRTSIGGHQRAGKAINYTNEFDNDHMQEQQIIKNNSESRNQNGDDTQAGKSSHSNACRDEVSLSSTDDHVNGNAKGQKNVVVNVQEQGRGDTEPHQQTGVTNNSQTQLPDNGGNSEPNNYHKEFPKISSNFDRHTISNHKGQQTNHPNQLKGPNNLNENQKIKQDQSTEPAPYTVVQTLAARLRQIHATHATSIELVPPKHTTKQGQPAVIYIMDDFMNKLTVDSKYTLIGKASSYRPS